VFDDCCGFRGDPYRRKAVEQMWQYGVAKLVKTVRGEIIVSCPHCADRHTHPRLSLGSKEVVAGCHIGGDRCRSYAIPGR